MIRGFLSLLVLIFAFSQAHALDVGFLRKHGVVSAPAGCAATYGAELATGVNASDDAGGNEADATTGWTGTGLATFDSITTAPQTGTYHLTGVSDSSADKFYRELSGTASTVYKLSYYVRHDGTATGTGDWGCYLGNVSTDINSYRISASAIVKTDTTYRNEYMFIFVNANQDNFLCMETNDENDGGIYLDNYSFKAATLCYGSELHADTGGSGNAASLTNEANGVGSFASTGTSAFESSATSPADGTYSIYTVVNANLGKMYATTALLTNTGLTAGKKYFISWKQKYASGDPFYCGLADASTLNFYATTKPRVSGTSADTEWTHVGFSFTYDATNHAYFGCKENGTNDNAAFYIDSISIKEIEDE